MPAIKGNKVHQRIKSLVALQDIEMEPAGLANFWVSNVFGRVFSYLVGKAPGGFRTIACNDSGMLLAESISGLYNPAGAVVLGSVAGWAKHTCEVTWSSAVFKRDAGGFSEVKLWYIDGTSSGKFYPFTEPMVITASQLVEKIQHRLKPGSIPASFTVNYSG